MKYEEMNDFQLSQIFKYKTLRDLTSISISANEDGSVSVLHSNGFSAVRSEKNTIWSDLSSNYGSVITIAIEHGISMEAFDDLYEISFDYYEDNILLKWSIDVEKNDFLRGVVICILESIEMGLPEKNQMENDKE